MRRRCSCDCDLDNPIRRQAGRQTGTSRRHMRLPLLLYNAAAACAAHCLSGHNPIGRMSAFDLPCLPHPNPPLPPGPPRGERAGKQASTQNPTHPQAIPPPHYNPLPPPSFLPLCLLSIPFPFRLCSVYLAMAKGSSFTSFSSSSRSSTCLTGESFLEK
jgi:hypothetical protein